MWDRAQWDRRSYELDARARDAFVGATILVNESLEGRSETDRAFGGHTVEKSGTPSRYATGRSVRRLSSTACTIFSELELKMLPQ